ncbi:hypothetical protein QR680_014607 [Steinernema hermaphroditum]|uniref:Ubiquitin-like domain-containing protein n=1 Tax=Steinernema hermaphroditum TaxID=289476 RepID=A0AA39M3I0_9BILA|nr:hypothetical protein QR680_014607 [Steinernema hermaphroditum]
MFTAKIRHYSSIEPIGCQSSEESPRSAQGEAFDSCSAGEERQVDMGSQKPSSPSKNGQLINITIKSMMESVKNVTITVRRDATVGDLKNACRRKMDICPRLSALVYNCVELKDDVKPLADYGITADCDVYLQLKLQAGTRNASPSAETVIFVMPDMFASGKEGIRDVIRSMNTALPVIPSSHQQCDATSSKTSKQQPWSLEKQMEHELTRNRMKVLTRRRRKANSVTHPSTPDSGSICGAKGHSPVSSSPGSPPNGLVHRKSVMTVKDSSSGPESNVEPKPLAVTAKELTMFFDPPETKQQLMMMRKDLYDPPQNRQELLKV